MGPENRKSNVSSQRVFQTRRKAETCVKQTRHHEVQHSPTRLPMCSPMGKAVNVNLCAYTSAAQWYLKTKDSLVLAVITRRSQVDGGDTLLSIVQDKTSC
ncbi:unnamed protein product [Leuciscus chuanchicus]